MNKETFAKYISNPSLLDNDTLPEIKAMLDEFPYFQSAWVLYIKNLHAIKDIRYESKLKTACAYISDRKHLHDILKGVYIPAIAPVQTQFIASPIEENPEEIAIVQPQNLVAQNESETNTTENVQTQFIASQEEEETIPQQEEILEDSTIVQTQNLASQPEEIAENTTSVQAQFIASQPEKEIADTEIQQSSTSTTPSEQDITTETKADDNVQTQFIASQEEAIVQPQNIVAQQEEIHEDTTQLIASQQETPASPEPDKPESLADRILRQVEEMRRAKAAAAAAAYTENQNSESPVETQDIASQSKEIPDTTIGQTQGLASQQDENAENPAIVQAQFIASQPEEDPEEIATVQPQNIVAQPEDITEDIPIVQTQFIASQPEEEAEEIATVQPQNIVAQAESEANTTENVQTQNIASQEITPAQIKALLEKQLHDIGINANITFTGNSANIQFENIATDEKPEENKPEQPIAEDESSTEITTAPTIEEQIEKRKSDRDKKANLIDKFIESKARIVPKKDYHSDNKLSTESIIEDEELFTEQLAKIYIKQGHLEKALETYEKLYLKYPEKNIYFATRIEYVKRLMNK